MPDLTIEYIRTCASNCYWQKNVTGSKGNVYTVTYGPVHGGPYSHGWECTCQGFKFGKKRDKDGLKTCSHIESVKPFKCSWNWEACMGNHAKTGKNDTCPECGGPTEVIKVGV